MFDLLVDFNATCDFEVDTCNFVVDKAAPLQWKIARANESTPDNWRPDTDYTSNRSKFYICDRRKLTNLKLFLSTTF